MREYYIAIERVLEAFRTAGALHDNYGPVGKIDAVFQIRIPALATVAVGFLLNSGIGHRTNPLGRCPRPS